mmetsp:Transcript_15823/g.45116  ORF Transcript_15823/g.45116 Transcript_15823/m.45116 type:complete len:279 (-) Transcript_15823:1043-1879(-)
MPTNSSTRARRWERHETAHLLGGDVLELRENLAEFLLLAELVDGLAELLLPLQRQGAVLPPSLQRPQVGVEVFQISVCAGDLGKEVVLGGVFEVAVDLLVQVQPWHGAVKPQLGEVLRLAPELVHLVPCLLHLLVLLRQLLNLALQLLHAVDVLEADEDHRHAEQGQRDLDEACDGAQAQEPAVLQALERDENLDGGQKGTEREAEHEPGVLRGEEGDLAEAEAQVPREARRRGRGPEAEAAVAAAPDPRQARRARTLLFAGRRGHGQAARGGVEVVV